MKVIRNQLNLLKVNYLQNHYRNLRERRHLRKRCQIPSSLQEHSDNKQSNKKTENAKNVNNYVNPKDTDNTLVLTDEMMDLIYKAKISLDKSNNILDYHLNIIHQLHADMDKNAEKY